MDYKEQARALLKKIHQDTLLRQGSSVDSVAVALLASHQEGIKEGAEKVRDAVEKAVTHYIDGFDGPAAMCASQAAIEAARNATGV